MMDRLLGDIPNVTIYLDDILLYSDSIDGLLELMIRVFLRLREVNLKLRAKKCHVGITKINYLGFIVSDKGIETESTRVESLREISTPRTVRELRRFLGMVSYYRNFIYQFSQIAVPLFALTSKTAKFIWTTDCQQAFDKLKDALCQAPVLAHPDLSSPFSIFTDASDVGLGAVLTQFGQPVWFASRVLTSAEIKYDTRQKECLAIMFGLEKFKPYFFGNQVTVFTDHGNLRWLMDQEQKGRLGRWQLYLQQFDFVINYVKGELNPVADCLSRDKGLLRIGAVEVVIPKKRRVSLENGSLTRNIDWKAEQLKDPYLVALRDSCKLPFVIENEILYRVKDDTNKKRVVCPDHLVDTMLQRAHDSALAAHGGVSKTSYHLKGIWFPSMNKFIKGYCMRCLTCLKAKGFGDRHNELCTREPLDILDRVYVDVVGPLPNDTKSYQKDARYILTIMDDGSRFLKAIPLRACKRVNITDAFLQHWVGTFGASKVLVTDNNEQFKGMFTDMCRENKINKEWTAPYSPEMNAVERVHKTLMNKLRALRLTENKPWTECLPLACLSYNLVVHSMTGYAPYSLMFAKEVDIVSKATVDINDIGMIRAKAKELAWSKRQSTLDKINESRHDEDISVGDTVVIKSLSPTKLENRVWEDKYKVIQQHSKNIFTLRAKNDRTFRRSRKDLKRLY